jgi:hypothetical protein
LARAAWPAAAKPAGQFEQVPPVPFWPGGQVHTAVLQACAALSVLLVEQ